MAAQSFQFSSKPQVNRNKILGKRGWGVVFQGVWHERLVAVRRVLLEDVESSVIKDEEAVLKLRHPNVIKLFHIEEDIDFR